jgi:hypothetical protein
MTAAGWAAPVVAVDAGTWEAWADAHQCECCPWCCRMCIAFTFGYRAGRRDLAEAAP